MMMGTGSSAKYVTLNNGTKLFYSCPNRVKESLTGREIKHLVNDDSDLLPGEYEGGLKIWECTLEFCNYIAENPTLVDGLNVLEIGCGSGLPAILALKLGAKSVAVQDFNDYVLDHFTMCNFTLNVEEDDLTKVSMIPGDWASCLEKLGSSKFDIILTSETLYNVDNYEALYNLIDKSLTSDGKVLLSTKLFYFGVGGSLPAWREHVARYGAFRLEEKWTSRSSMPRKIVEMCRI